MSQKIEKYQKGVFRKTKRISKKITKSRSLNSSGKKSLLFPSTQPVGLRFESRKRERTRKKRDTNLRIQTGLRLGETSRPVIQSRQNPNEPESFESQSKSRHFLSRISKSTCTKNSRVNQSPASLNISPGEAEHMTQSEPKWPQSLSEIEKKKLERLLESIPVRFFNPKNIENLWIDPSNMSIYQKLAGSELSPRDGNLIQLVTLRKHPDYGWRGWPRQDNYESLEASAVGGELDQEQIRSLEEKLQISNLPLLVRNFKLKLKRKLRNKKKSNQGGCGCSKSKCLRLHCKCFRNGKMCTESCRCTSCFNNEEHVDVVNKIRAETKKVCSKAFDNPVITMEINGVTKAFSKGCSCTKYQCMKKYCGCHRNGFECNPLCKCVDCNNSKIEMDPVKANELYQKSTIFRRKKNKSVNLSSFVGEE